MTSIEINNIVDKWFDKMLALGCERFSGKKRHAIATETAHEIADEVSQGVEDNDEGWEDIDDARRRFWAKCQAKRIAGEIVIY